MKAKSYVIVVRKSLAKVETIMHIDDASSINDAIAQALTRAKDDSICNWKIVDSGMVPRIESIEESKPITKKRG